MVSVGSKVSAGFNPVQAALYKYLRISQKQMTAGTTLLRKAGHMYTRFRAVAPVEYL